MKFKLNFEIKWPKEEIIGSFGQAKTGARDELLVSTLPCRYLSPVAGHLQS